MSTTTLTSFLSSVNWPDVLTTIFGSGVIVALISHFFENRMSREERKNLLAKEIYFKLQEKTEEIRICLETLIRKMESMSKEIKLKLEKGINESNYVSWDDYENEKIKLITNLKTYFPRMRPTEYEHIIKLLSETSSIYKKFKDNGGSLTREDIGMFASKESEFTGAVYSLEIEIQGGLNDARNEIK
jgi:hypothetical protein